MVQYFENVSELMQPTEGIRIINCNQFVYHLGLDIYGICNIDEQGGSSLSAYAVRSLHNGALQATELWDHGKCIINIASGYIQTCNMLTGLAPNKMTNHARSAPKLTLGLLPACPPSCNLNVLKKSVYQTIYPSTFRTFPFSAPRPVALLLLSLYYFLPATSSFSSSVSFLFFIIILSF